MDSYTPPNDPLVIFYHDHELLVVNKPSGMLSVPGKGTHLADCLIAPVYAAFPSIPKNRSHHQTLGSNTKARRAPRLMLHAESLRLRHPDGGKGMTFRAKCGF